MSEGRVDDEGAHVGVAQPDVAQVGVAQVGVAQAGVAQPGVAPAGVRRPPALDRWLPSPLLSASLWALWLLLNDSVHPAHLLLGLVVGLVAPLLAAPLRPRGARLRNPRLLVRLIVNVGGDVVRSALVLARAVLRGDRRPPRGAFVRVPLDLQDAHGLAALAIITAVVPGTVWTELAADRGTLLIHVFDLEGDEAAFIAGYKARYELPLKEIFE